MADTIVSSFLDSMEAEMARAALVRAGLSTSSISIVSTDANEKNPKGSSTYDESNPYLPGLKRKVRRGDLEDAADNSSDAPTRTAIGFILGSVIGAGIAWVASIEPGFTTFVDAQPIIFFVGISAAGGMLGGIVAALSSSSKENGVLHYYREAGKERWMVSVDCEHKLASAVVKILVRNGGTDIKFISKPIPASSFQFRPGATGGSVESKDKIGTGFGQR